MTNTRRLKARLVREAVEENVATMHGRLPRPLRRGRRLAALWGPRSLFVLLLLALVATSRLALESRTAAARARVAPEDLAVTAAAPRPAPGLESPLPRPQPLSVSSLGLAVRSVVIDAGHGGKSLGTSAASGLHEKDVTLDIAQRLRARLIAEGLTVLMTRVGDDAVSLQQRSEMANQGHGDLFVSIHVNSLTSKGRGIETYYLGASEAPAADAIAAEENRDSGYSLADLRTLLDGIYIDARKGESRRLAESVQQALLRDIRRVNPAVEDRGVKTAPFVVLIGTEMPAILAEVSCLSNADEAALLSGHGYRQSIADALFDGIRVYLRGGTPVGSKETADGSD